MKKVVVAIGIVVTLLSMVTGAMCREAGSPGDEALLKAVVHSAALGLGAVAVNSDGTYNAVMIRTYVDAVRFLDDQTGYFFVYDYNNNVNIANAALKDFPGKDKTLYQDSRGMYVIQELSKIAKDKTGSGFLLYHWINPKTGKEERKISYIEVIPGTSLYIGAGMYMP